jgi:hypothetical protein
MDLKDFLLEEETNLLSEQWEILSTKKVKDTEILTVKLKSSKRNKVGDVSSPKAEEAMESFCTHNKKAIVYFDASEMTGHSRHQYIYTCYFDGKYTKFSK